MNATITKLADDLIADVDNLSETLTESEFRENAGIIIANYLRRAYNQGRVSMIGLVEDGNE